MFPGLKPTPQSIINAFVKKQALITPAAAPVAAPVTKPSTPTIARGVSGLNKYWQGPSADNSLGSMAGLGFGAAAGGIAAAAAGTALLPWVTLGAGLGVAAPQVYDYFTKPKGAPPSVLPPSILSKPDSAPEFNIGVNRGYTYRDKGVFGPQPKILGWNGDTPILQDAPTDGSWASRLANASSKWAWEQKIRDEKQAFEKPGEEATLGLPGRIFKNYIGDFGLAFGTLPERLKGVAARTSQMPKGSNKPYGFLMGQNPEWMPNEDAGHGAVMELFRTLEPESQAIEQLWGFGRGVTGSFANTPEQTLNYKMAGKYSAGERAHIISKFRMDGQWPTDKVGPIQTLDYVNAHLSDAINNAESIFGRLPAGEQLFSMIALPNTAQMLQSKVPKFFRLIPKMGKMDEALVPSFSVLEDWSRIRKSAHHRKTREYMASIAFTTDQTPEFQSAFIKFNPQSNNFWSPNSFAQTIRKGLVKAGATTFQYDIGTIASINATHGLEALLETIFPMFDNDNVGMAVNGLLSLKNYGPKGFTDELGNVVNATKEQLDFLQVFKEMGLVDLEVTEGLSKLYGLKKGRVVSPINSTNNLVGRQVLRNIVDSVIDQKGVGKEGAQTFVHTKLVDLLTAIKGDLSGKIPDIAALKASGKSTLEINNLVKLGKEAYKLEANRIDRAQMNLLDWAVRATLYTDFKQADYAKFTTPNEWKQWQSFFAKWYQIGTNPGVAVRNSFQDITKLMLQDRQLLMTNNTQFMKYFRDNSQSFTMLRGLGKEGMRKIRARGIEIDLSTKPKNAFENFLTLGTTLMQESEEFNTSLIAAGTIKRIMEKFGEVAPDISDLAGMPPEKIQNLVNIVQSVMLPSELKKAKDMYLRNPKFFQLQDEFVNAIKGINSNGVEERARIAVMEILGKHEGKPNEMKTALQELLNSIIEDHTPKRKFVNGKFVSEEVIRSPIEYRRGKPKPEEEAVVFDAFNDINQAVKTDDLGEALIFARTYPELQYSKQVVEELQEQGVDVQRTTDKIYDENPWLAKAVGETEDTVPEVPSAPSYIINNPPEPSADQVIEQGIFDINVKRISSTYSEPTGSKPGSSQADILNTDEIHRHFDDDFHPDNVPENTQSDTTYDEATRFYRISLNAIKLMLDKLSQDTTGRVINLNTIIMRPNASKDPITFVEFLNQFQPNRQFILKHTHNNFEAVPVKDLAMLRVEIDALERYHNGKLGHIASSLRNDAAYLTRAQEGQRLPDYLGKEKLTYVELSKFFYDPKNNQVNNYVESVWKVFHDLTFGTPESELAYSKLKVMTALTPEERAVAEEVLQQARKVEARAAYLRMQKDIDFPGFPGSPGNVVNRKNDYIAAVEYIKANWMNPGQDFTVEKEALRTLPSKSDIMRDDAKRLLNNLGLSRADAQKVLDNLGSRVKQHGKIASKQFKIYELDDLLDAVIEERLIGTGIKKGRTLPEAVSKIFERYITVDGQAYEVVARQGDNITEVYKESSIYGMVPRGQSLPAGKLKNANVKETQKFTAAKKRDVVGFIERNEQSSASLFEFTGDADARIIIQALMENPGVSIDAKSHLAFLKNKYPNIKLSSISAEKYSLPIPPEFLDARLKKEKGSKFYVENLGVKIKEAESRGVLDIKKGVKPIENYISTDFYFPELDPQFLPQWEKIIDDMAVSVILSRYGKLSDVDLQNEQAIVSSLHQLYSDTKDYAKLEFVKGLIESLAVKTKNLPIELEDLGKYYREQLIAIELGEILNYKELGKHEELALVIEKKFDQILDAMAAPRVAVTTADASVPIRRTPFVAPRPAAAKVVAAATPSVVPIEGAEQIRTVTLKDNRVIQVKGDGDNMKWMSPSAPVTSQGPRWWPVSDKMKRRIAFATPESFTPIPDAPKAPAAATAVTPSAVVKPVATPTLAQADIATLTLQRNKLYNTLESFKGQKLTPDIVRSKTATNTEIKKIGKRLKELNERVELEQLRADKAQGQQPLTQVSSVVLPAKALTGEFQPSRYDVDSLAKAFDFKPADAAILNFFYRNMPIDLDNLKVARGNFINNADFVQSGVGEVKGFTQAMDDGTHIIAGLKSSDRFTAIHEMNHVVIKNVFDKSKPLAQRYGITDRHIDIVMDWAGVKEGVWQAENHEKLSMGLLRYFIDGVSPSNVLKYVFEKIRFWYHDLYRHIYPELAEMKVPKEVTEVFDLVVTARLRELYASRDAVNLHTQDISEEINALKNSIAALQRASIPPIQRTPFVTSKGLTKSYKDIRIYHGMNDEKERWFTSSETVAKAWVGSTVGKTTTIDPATGKVVVNIYDINPTHSPLKQLQYIDVTPSELAQIRAQNESIMRLKETGVTDSVESFLKQRAGLVEEDRAKTYLATLYFDLESLNEQAKRYAESRLISMRNYDGAYDIEEDLRTTKKELAEAIKKFRAHEEEVELVITDLKDDLEIAALMSRIKKLKNEVEINLEKELFAKQDKDYRKITTLEARDPRKKDKVTKFAPVKRNAYGKELKQGEAVEQEALETAEFSVSETTSDEIALKKLRAQGKEKPAHAYFIDKLLDENFKLSKILERFEDPNYVPLIPDLKAQAQYHRQQNIDYIQYYYGVEEPFIHHPITRGAKATEFFVPESIMSRSKSLVDWEPSKNPKMQVGELQGEKSKIREAKRLLAEQLLFDQRRDLAEYWLDKQTIERKINSLKSKQKLTKDEQVELESLKGKFQALETRVMEGLLPDLQALWNAENKAQVLQVHIWYNDWKALQLTRDEVAERVSRIESIDRELSGDDYVRFASGEDVPFFALPMIDAAGQGTRKFKSKKINKEIKELKEDDLYYVPKYSETGLGNTTDKIPTDNQRIEEYRKQLLSYIARIDSDMVVLSDRINRVPQTKQDILNRIQKLSALRDADPRWRYVPVENVKGRNIPINENVELFSPNYLKRVEDTVSEVPKDYRPVARNYTDQTLAAPLREAPEIPTQSIEAKDLQDNSFKIDTIELAPGYQPIEATQIAGANPNLKYISGTTSQVQGDKNAIFVLNPDNSVSYTDLQPKTETQINEILQADRMNNGSRQSVKSEFVIDQGQYQLSAVELREARVFQTMDSITQLVKAIDLSTSKTAPIAINPEDAQFAESISKFFIKRQNELNQTRNVAQMVSTEMVNNYVYDYGMKYNFDHWAEMLFGYPLWYLRTFSDFPRQILTDPNYLLQLYQFNRVLNNLHRDEENLPLWMRSSVPLNVERFGLKDLIGTDTVYLPLLSQISPIESLLNGDFTNATREKSWYGAMYNTLYGWGPGPHALIPLAIGTGLMALSTTRDDDSLMNQASQYFGHLGSGTRVISSITAEAEKLGLGSPISGGVSVDPLLMAISAVGSMGAPQGIFLRGLMGASAIAQFATTHVRTKDGIKFVGPVYDQRRVANVLTAWGNEVGKVVNGVEITQEILQDASIVSRDPYVLGAREEYARAYTVWSAAVTEARAQKVLPNIISYFGGPGMSGRGENEKLQEEMYNSVDALYDMQKDPNISKEDYEKAWLTFSIHYPNFPVYSMFKKYGKEAFQVYAYSALSRVGRGASSKSVYDTVGLDYNVVNEFFNNKGVFKYGTDSSNFKEGIVKLALLLQSPDVSTKEEWGEAGILYHRLQREMEIMFPGTTAKQDVYYDLETKLRPAFLREHLDLKSRMDTELSVLVQDPTYRDKMTPYYLSIKEAGDFIKMTYMSQDPVKAEMYQYYLENFRDWATEKEKQFLADYDLFEFHRGYLKVTANLDNSVASLSTGLTLPKLPKVRVDAPELEAKKAIENALETLAQKNRDNYSRANAVGALSGATAGGVVAGSGVAGGGAGGGKFGTGTGSDLMANWEYLYSLKNANKIGYVKELGDQLKYETLQPILNAVNGNPTAFLNALDTPLLSGKWSTFNDPLKWEENLVNYVKMLGGENLRSSMMLEASRGSLDPSQMVWSKVIGTVKSLSDAEIGALTARHPELRDLQQVRAEAREHPSPTLNALMDVVGANISIQEDGTISVSGQTVKKDKPKTGGKKGDRLDGGDIEEYISKWAKHYYGANIEQLYDQYIMVSVAQGANAGRKFWKQYPQLAQYQAFSNKLWKRYKENKSGPPTKQQELDKIVKGVGIMMSTSKQQARGDSNQNSYSIMREIISNRKMYLPKSPIREKSNKIDGAMYANVIAVIKASNPNLAITFAEFMQANPVRRQAMLQSNPDLARYITQFTPEQLGDIEQSYNVGLEIGGQSTSRGGGVRVYEQRSGRTGL